MSHFEIFSIFIIRIELELKCLVDNQEIVIEEVEVVVDVTEEEIEGVMEEVTEVIEETTEVGAAADEGKLDRKLIRC